MNWQRFFDQISEKPQQRGGGFIFRMEDAAEARSRRRPTTELRSGASHSRTPRLDAMRHGLTILTYMLEREEREERDQ